MTDSHRTQGRRIGVIAIAAVVALGIVVPSLTLTAGAATAVDFTTNQTPTDTTVQSDTNVTFNVSMSDAAGDANSVALDVNIPSNWSVVAQSSDPSAFDYKSSEIQWLWLPNDPANTTFNVTYTVSIPADTAEGQYTIEANGNYNNGTAFWNNETATVRVNDNPPVITNASAVDAEDGDGNVTSGDNITVSADVDDVGALVDTVTADASAFGAGNVTLSDANDDGTFNATLTVNSSEAAGDGAQQLTITANDSGGLQNQSTTNTLTLDTTEPSLSSATLSDADGDGAVTDNQTVTVSADVSDATTSIESVKANASAFGAGTFQLTDGDNDGTFNGTFVVNGSQAGPDGLKAVAVAAIDTVGNANATATNNLTLDTTAPTIANPSLDDADGDGNVSGNDSVTVSADVTDAGVGVDHVAADASDFGAGVLTLTDSDGDDTYNATFTVNASQAAANGSYALTIAANDTINNSASATSNELQLNTSGTAGTATETSAEPVSGQADGFGLIVAVLAFLLTGFAARRRS